MTITKDNILDVRITALWSMSAIQLAVIGITFKGTKHLQRYSWCLMGGVYDRNSGSKGYYNL